MVERIRAHGVPYERIALIPNGVDPAEIGLDHMNLTPANHWQQIYRDLRLLALYQSHSFLAHPAQHYEAAVWLTVGSIVGAQSLDAAWHCLARRQGHPEA